MKTGERLGWIGIAAAALAGMALILFSTRWGPGVGGDATIYMTSAGNLLAGKGLGLIEADGSFRLLPYSAPFFPLVLAFLKWLGFEMVTIARILNTLLFGGLILLSGWTVKVVTRSALAGVGAALLMALSPILTPVYSWAMAEPLTLLLGFGGLWLMVRQIEQPDRTWPLLLSALLTGLALLTRYSAAAFVAAAGLGWLLFARISWRSTLARMVFFSVIALLPMTVWILAQFSNTSGFSSRSLEDAATMAERMAAFWPQFGKVLLSWLIPASWIEAPAYPAMVNDVLALGIGLVVIGICVFFFRTSFFPRGQNRFIHVWPSLTAIFLVLYVIGIFLSYLTTYPPITLDNRMFSPVHVGVLILLPIILDHLFTKNRKTILRFAPLMIVFTLAAWYGWRDMRIVKQNFDEGLGYNSVAWRSSELVGWVNKSPPDTVIVTNETMALLYLTGRSVYPLAEIYANNPGDLNAPYGSAPADEGQRLFMTGRNPLVLFDTISTQLESIYGDQTAERVEALTAGLEKAFEAEDGAVYYAP